MKKMSNRDLRELVQRAEGSPEIPSADVFWDRFRARAEMVSQERPASVAHGSGRLWPRIALAGVTVLALALLIVTLEMPRQPANGGSLETPLSRVDELDVYIDHTSVMIMKDRHGGGTLVWITGTEAATDG